MFNSTAVQFLAGMFDEGKEEGGVEDETEDEEGQEEGEEGEGKEFAEEPPDEDDRNCPPHEFECWTEDCIALRYFLAYILHKILHKKGNGRFKWEGGGVWTKISPHSFPPHLCSGTNTRFLGRNFSVNLSALHC